METRIWSNEWSSTVTDILQEQKALHAWPQKQLESISDPRKEPKKSDLAITDDDIRTAIKGGQLKLQKERGSDLTLFSPIASQMAHPFGQ